MPKTTLKVKTGNKHDIAYVVNGSLTELSREQLEVLALRQLRNSARTFMVQKLNEAEPAVIVNQEMKKALISSGMADEEKAVMFFTALGKPLTVPTSFEIPIAELMPSESGRGKKAADIFTLESVEEDDADDSDEA